MSLKLKTSRLNIPRRLLVDSHEGWAYCGTTVVLKPTLNMLESSMLVSVCAPHWFVQNITPCARTWKENIALKLITNRPAFVPLTRLLRYG